jgi:hypothetical protein
LIDSSVLGRATLGSKQEGSRYISYNVGSIHEGEMEDGRLFLGTAEPLANCGNKSLFNIHK